ncbi:MAG TPA: N-terminal phage integrase SAM-like domain-containing protein [Acidimicrobiales bacterium]|nr:N-terminal phage integrase SAM-like domain-containing protein [Acidimicrobiales bacterium]
MSDHAGPVFRRGEMWSFVVDLPPSPDGRRRQRKKGGFRVRRDAEAALAALLTDIQSGSVVETSRQTLAQYLEEWLAAVTPSLRPTTAESYERAVRNWIVPCIGGMRLQAVTPQVLQRHYAELSTSGRRDGSGGLGRRSVKLARTVLHLALERAAAWRMIPANPAAMRLDLPREVRREMTTWTPEEARRFLARDRARPDRRRAR